MTVLNEKVQATERLQNLSLDDKAGHSNPLSESNLEQWEKTLLEEPKNRLTLGALAHGDMTNILRNRQAMVNDSVHVFSDKIELEGSPVTNQQSSGRCWIFAATNVFRTFVQSKYNIEDFQLSQNYLFFYDKLEKANWFLQQAIETSDWDLESRLVQTLFGEPVSDGGQWDMIVNLVEKYGVVPRDSYPDTWNSTHSSKVNYVVLHKLREYGLTLRNITKEDRTKAFQLKEKYVQEIHDILVLTLGPPPRPEDEITWEYYDKNKKYHCEKTTPKKFLQKYTGFDATAHFSLIHDPRNPFEKLYTVDRLGNVVGGKPIEYVNAEIDVLKQASIKSIQNNEPVFFGSDVGKLSERSGIMDVNAWDYELAFNTSLGMTKAERLLTGESAMTHAMVLTAVNLIDGKPTKWRVENSWGDSSGEKGYMIMSDDWFNEYVYQVVVEPKYVDKKYTNIWKGKDYTTLPRWDPLGALA